MDGRERWMDNMFVERLWRSVKYKEVYLEAYENGAEARGSLNRYFGFHNQKDTTRALTGKHPIRSTIKTSR